MRGEFLGVWQETWREIWEPLVNDVDVPADLFCELYRDLDQARKEPSLDESIAAVMNDPLQRREVFDRALFAAEIDIESDRRETVFQSVDIDVLTNASDRRRALEAALVEIIGDADLSGNVLTQALTRLANDPVKRKEAHERALESIINDTLRSQEAFEAMSAEDFGSEQSVVEFLEAAHGILEDLGNDQLANRYYNLLSDFLEKFSLRYDLRRPCALCPTLPGVFSSLMRDLRRMASEDAHLNGLMREFEDSVRDLRADRTDRRIKTCIQKQINLLEALGGRCEGVTHNTLGDICKQIGNWPHTTVSASLGKLYGFASSYPGIRHGGNPKGVLRDIDMRDMIAMSVLLAGFTPYFVDQYNAGDVYGVN
jgi:hypothetical protein